MLFVNNHTKFACFDYVSQKTDVIELGAIVKYTNDNMNDIGVVIQTFDDGEFRTDMNGMTHISEVVPATISDVREFRPAILSEVKY